MLWKITKPILYNKNKLSMKHIFTRMYVLLLAVMLISSTAVAQTTVSGTVTDSDNIPLIGVSVSVKGTPIGTITDIDGKYSLKVPDGATALQFDYVGFSTIEQAIDGSSSYSIVLSDSATELDEIVVTGLATSVKRSNLANSVASISAAELTGVTVPTTTDAALYGKFKGAEIRASSGAPGGGISVKLRGTTSINGSSQPLFIIDGVYIDNSAIPAGLNSVSRASSGGSTSNQDNPSNRLADIDPEDIENIEILKGASAAAQYGSRASGGVVIITTKKGKAGPTEVQFGQSIGWTEMLNPLGQREWTEDRVLNSNFVDAIDEFRAGPINNYEELLYGNKGLLATSRLSIRGGSDKTKFFIGTTYKNEDGIVENTGYDKTSARININHKLTEWLDLSTTTAYINSSADRGFFNNDNSGTTMGISFTSTPSFAQLLPDSEGVYPANPYAPSNFLETAAKVTNNEKVNRLLGGGSATAKLFTNDNNNLRLILRGGIDYYNLATSALFPNDLQFQRDGAGLNGVSVQGSTNNFNSNVAAFLVHSLYTDSGLNFRTQLGLTQESFNRNTILGEAFDMIGSQTNLDQGGSRNVTQTRLLQKDKGFFVQEELNWDDKVMLTVGLRGDKSSNNSDANQLFYYPKASVAVNLHEFGFLPQDGVLSQFKVRTAYGQSGNFPQFGAKFTSFGSTIVDGMAGVTIGSLQGNSAVGPERQTEVEFGFDLGFLNNRILLDATYYVKSVSDLLLNADVPTSSGFTSQVTNAAELQNRGLEIGLNAKVIDGEDFDWFSRVNWWKNNAEVTRLSVPAFTTGGFADFLGNFMVKEGYSPTAVIGVGANPDITLNGTGEPTLQLYGDAEPDFQTSFYNQLSYKDVDLTFLVHWKKGGKNINLSTLLFDLNNTTHDFDDVELDPEGALGNGDYRLSQLGVNTAPYIEDASYVRLREIGLFYNIPKSTFNDLMRLKVGFSGTNLLNFFEYNSYDPEVSNFGSGGLSTGVEVTPFPSAKRFNFHVTATF